MGLRMLGTDRFIGVWKVLSQGKFGALSVGHMHVLS